MPLQVIHTKSRSIWDDINPFVEILVAAYKQSQETKWNNEWQLSALADIENANKPQEVIDFLELQKIPEENLDIPGFTQFANDCMGMLAKQEMMFEDDKPLNAQAYGGGGVGATPGMEAPKPNTMLPQPTPVKTTKSMPNVKEFNNLYKFVSELPTGKVDWTNTLDLFKERLESGRAMGSAAQQFLSMIMGQSMPINQRQKVQEDFEFTKDIKDTLYPEMVEKAPSSELEYWLQEHPGKGVEDYWKAKAGKEEGIDIDTFIKELDVDLEISNVNVSATGKVNSFSLKPKDTTTDVDIKTTIAKAEEWVANHPGTEIDDINFKTGSVSIGRISKTEGDTGKLVPTYQTIRTINEDLLNPGNDYDEVLHNAQVKYNLKDVKLVSKADQAKMAYDKFGEIIVGEEYIDEKGLVTDPEAYSDYYKDYEAYAKKFFEQTGQILPKKFLSIEEAGKYETIQWGLGKAKGGDRPVFNTENIPWKWQGEVDPTKALFDEMRRSGLTPQDYDLEALAREQDVDIPRLLQMFK